jgi:transcriptional regulator with XRE-family HTH domain
MSRATYIPEMAEHIGRKIRARRTALGLTMADVADECLCNSGHICRLEHGWHCPSIQMLYMVATALEVQPGDLLPRVGEVEV